MTIFTSVKDYIKRHRKGLLVTATIAGGGYFAGKYATNKIREMQEKSSADRLAKENLKRRFQQNQNDCVFTVLSLLPTLGDQILHEMNIEKDWAKLQESRKLEKIELRLKKEREEAALLREEKEAMEQLQEGSVVLVEQPDQEPKTEQTTEESAPSQAVSVAETAEEEAAVSTEDTKVEEKTPPVQSLESSTSSLATSIQLEEDRPLPAGILDKKEKHLLWEDIKSKSFTRSLTSIYSATLLTLLTHIQLNLLGRFTYVWSVSILNKSEPTIRLQQEGEEPDVGFLDPQVERMFLSTSWWLLHRGWKACAKRVQEAVDEIVSSIPLKSNLDYHDAEVLLHKLRQRIEYDDVGKPINYRRWMLPDTEEEEKEFLTGAGFDEGFPKEGTSTITLSKLLDETKDFIDSPDFTQVLKSCLDEVFAIFDHHAFASALLPQQSDSFVTGIREVTAEEALQLEPTQKKVSLANLLPTIGRQAHLVIAGNEYLNAFAYIKELQAFSALIYTQYGDECTI